MILLETGYGPSGAPHIGTFAEVARTSWVGEAIGDLAGKSWTLIAFSDDMDGLRKVPLNMPAEKLEPHLGKPLSHVPDPFDCHASYAAHNNSLLMEMLDRFGFSYDFRSSHELYTSGAFNDGLGRIMASYEAVRALIIPTIRKEKRDSWSPFLPICQSCGVINGTRVTGHDPDRLTVSYVCEGETAGAVADEPPEETEEGDMGQGRRPGAAGCGSEGETSILDGKVKVGWKVDWALRWFVLGVQYEMYGKDLIESADLSAQIHKVISGGDPGPVRSFYEMFLDEEGRKISKSVGRGITVDSWLGYAPMESLLLFIFKDPRKAKKLSWEAMIRSVDEYIQLIQRESPAAGERARDVLGFIFREGSRAPTYEYPVTYSMLLGLISSIGMPAPDVVIRYVHRYQGARPASDPFLTSLIEHATRYVEERILPARSAPSLSAGERRMIASLVSFLEEEQEADAIQTRAFDIAREEGIEPKDLFRTLYQVLTGQESGPRLGPFVKLIGQDRAVELLRQAAG